MGYFLQKFIGFIHGSDPVRPASSTDIPSCCLDEVKMSSRNILDVYGSTISTASQALGTAWNSMMP